MTRPIRVLGIALSLTLLAGSGFLSVGHAAGSRSPVTVEYWSNLCWQPAKTYMQQLVTAFNSSHRGIVLKWTCFSNASVLQPRLQAAIQQHRPPALSQTDAFAVATYVDQGAVQDLTSYVHGKNGLTAGQIRDYFAPQWQNGLYRGRIYSLPLNDTSVTVMWYNPKLIRAAHITRLPRTWSQFAADCAKVTRGGNWCMDTTDNEEPLWEAMVREWGGQLVDKSGKKAAFDSPAGAAAVQFWIHLIQKKEVHHTNSATTQWEQDFASGHVAFEMYSSEGVTDTQSIVGKKFTVTVAQLPAGPRNADCGNGGDNIFVFNGASAAAKQAAWTYIKWATSPRWTAWWAEKLGTAPVRSSAVRLMSGYLKTHPSARPAIQELSRAYFSPTVSGWGQAQGDIDTEISKAELGQESASQAMKNAAAKVNHDLSTAG
jgi:multiple sugar transport system substrate-binding protein